MEIQPGKMILNGIIYALLYIGAPLIILFLLDFYNIINFSSYFFTGILIFGIIGTVMAVLKAAYPKDSAKNRVIMFLITIYSGVYLFYIFGGFDPTAELGNFSISTSQISVFLGLKLIAWLALISAGVRSLQYFFEALELRGVEKDSLKYKKRAKPSLLFKVIGTLISIGLAFYIISVIGSGVMIRPNLQNFSPDYDDAGTPVDPSDDTFNMTITFGVSNNGIYPLRGLIIHAEIWSLTSENTTALPLNTKVGESPNVAYGDIAPFSEITAQNITIIIDSNYDEDLAEYDATLEILLDISLSFGGISINLNITFPTPWTAPIP
ncbi:MAG: hypothetical protein GF317_03185 [Candidatus Lokiarchaeota archaeon]|nr:hypothetical protein [Candidatus Lokiarchaeota archaeon]MBD3198912.1 hypothetical protein [Candidatus Lokiarchaeota archaeon]